MKGENKKILDMCCGGKHFWFDKNNENVLFMDKRKERKGFIKEQPGWECNPNIVADFTNIPFEDNTFYLVVFDPPHVITNSDGIITKKYGRLDDDYKDLIKKGFAEAFRVLKPNGTLVFKWNDLSVRINEILKLSPKQPLIGTKTKKGVNNTYFYVFMKY